VALRGLAALLLPAASAWAALGGDVAGVQSEQSRMRASRVVASAPQGVTVHDTRLADGSSIRQYVNARGIVFAVAWSTRLKPDFSQLLGRYETEFDAGVADAVRPPGLKRTLEVQRGELVVHSAGRIGAFVGKAWLTSQLPAGVSPDAVR
jgi:Protein of unknown function (DUF2844)